MSISRPNEHSANKYSKTIFMKTNEKLLGPGDLEMFDRWQTWGLDYSMDPSRFDSTNSHPIKFKIGEKVFTEWSEDFKRLYDQTILWEQLQR